MTICAITADLGLNRRPGVLRDPLWWMALCLGTLAPIVAWRVPGVEPGASVPQGLAAWCSVLVWQPFLEELLFRGLLQGMLLERAWGKGRILGLTFANLVTSALFVAVHFVHHPPLWALAVLPPSLILGGFRERHGNVWSPLLLHGLFNLAFFASAALAAG